MRFKLPIDAKWWRLGWAVFAIGLIAAMLAIGLLARDLARDACAQGGCGGACNPHRGIWCAQPGCLCQVQGPDGWGVCFGVRT